MPRLPRLTGKELMKCVKRYGFILVPVHAGETIGPGLLRKILNQTELTAEELQ